ncbi:MAG: hypothetical protein RAP03_11100 [Candidatus Electryonea clarkiae]|nr:hypothetical protein [Candidatus Electryonea clarkiae]
MLKKYALFMILIIAAFIVGCSEKEKVIQIDVTDYDINIGFSSPREMVISAVVSCTIQGDASQEGDASKEGDASQMEFLLNPAVGIHAIFIKNNDEWSELSYDREDAAVLLSIPDSVASTDRVLRFDYVYPLEEPLGRFFYIDRGNRWYPLIIDDVANVRINATVLPGFSMFSCGDLVNVTQNETRSTYEWATKIPVFKIPFVLLTTDMYAEISAPCNDNEITFYVLNENPETDPMILGEACAMFGYCESLIGAYPHKKLTFIETDIFQGMSFIASGLVLISSDFMEQFRQRHTQGLHLPIVMQWFGSGVFATFQDDGFWFFSLSLPHYLRLMAVQRFEGNESFIRGMEVPYDMYLVYADTEDDVPVLDVDMLDSPAKGYSITGKGPRIFDHIRKEMGDKDWQSFLRDLYEKFLGKTIIYEEFMGVLSHFADPKLVKEFDNMTHARGALSR